MSPMTDEPVTLLYWSYTSPTIGNVRQCFTSQSLYMCHWDLSVRHRDVFDVTGGIKRASLGRIDVNGGNGSCVIGSGLTHHCPFVQSYSVITHDYTLFYWTRQLIIVKGSMQYKVRGVWAPCKNKIVCYHIHDGLIHRIITSCFFHTLRM